MLQISDSKPDIPCLLTQKLQPVPGTRENSKTTLQSVFVERRVNFDVFLNKKATRVPTHRCTQDT